MLNWHLFFFISVDPRALNLAHGVICSQTTSSSKNLRTTWEWFVQVKDHPLGSMITLEVECIQITLKSTLNNLICMARLSYISFDSQLLFSQQPEIWWYQKISEKKGLSFPATETKPGWIQGGGGRDGKWKGKEKVTLIPFQIMFLDSKLVLTDSGKLYLCFFFDS